MKERLRLPHEEREVQAKVVRKKDEQQVLWNESEEIGVKQKEKERGDAASAAAAAAA